MTKETIAKAPERRTRRTPIGTRNILTVSGKDPDFVYRFVNDTGDRVQAFIENGWETVPANNVRIGDKRINGVSPDGTVATASVGRGAKAVLLRIKKEWAEEDAAAKQVLVSRTEETMRKEALDGNYGKLEISRD